MHRPERETRAIAGRCKGGLECTLTEITVPFSGIMRWLALNETLEIWKILLDWLE